jgi:hypothetical protein
LAFKNRGSQAKRVVNVRLSGKTGNPTAIGARVQVTRTDGFVQAFEVYAGGGYLSQSSSVLTFGLGETSQVRQVRIRWPDGRETSEMRVLERGTLVFQQLNSGSP